MANDAVSMDPVLTIEGLTVDYRTETGTVRAVELESLTVQRGEFLGLVGESGCGKSTVAQAIMGLLPRRYTKVGGAVRLHGQNLLTLSENALRDLRGSKMAMIFQEPATALNPVFTVGEQIARVVRIHQGVSWKAARDRAVEMLELVGMPDPSGTLSRYPHQLSGGQKQRIMIAMALSCGPDLLIADEPTTALDVTIEAQILNLLKDLQSRLGMAVLLITHDLGVVAQTCDRVAVMYAGRAIEQAPVGELFREPLHPYSKGLLGSVPRRGHALTPIEGTVPDLRHMPAGCRFAPRCPLAQPSCQINDPWLQTVGRDRAVACPIVRTAWVEKKEVTAGE